MTNQTDKLDGTIGHEHVRTAEVQDAVVKIDLSFPLTESDYAEKGREAGRVAGELRLLEEEFDELKKEWKGKIEKLENALGEIHRTIRIGKEERTVKCIERKDFNSHRVTHIFNGEVMNDRVMELHERQLTLIRPTDAPQTEAQAN